MPTIDELRENGLDNDEIGELAAQSHAEGLDTIDWNNLTDEQVELILDEHNCTGSPMDGCAVHQKLYEAGKIPAGEDRIDFTEEINQREL